MLSRVAESIYWMNRYIERVENTVRFIDVNLNIMVELPPNFEEQWQPLIATSGDEESFKKNYQEATKENVVHFLTFDKKNPNAILSCLNAARENARSMRERISTELWEEVNATYLLVKEAEKISQWSTEDMLLFFEKIKKSCYLIAGISNNTLSYSEMFLDSQRGVIPVRRTEAASGNFDAL